MTDEKLIELLKSNPELELNADGNFSIKNQVHDLYGAFYKNPEFKVMDKAIFVRHFQYNIEPTWRLVDKVHRYYGFIYETETA